MSKNTEKSKLEQPILGDLTKFTSDSDDEDKVVR